MNGPKKEAVMYVLYIFSAQKVVMIIKTYLMAHSASQWR